MEQSPGRGSGLHIRLLCLLTLLHALDTAMVLYAVDKTVKDGPSVHALFACEVCMGCFWRLFWCFSSYSIAYVLLLLYSVLKYPNRLIICDIILFQYTEETLRILCASSYVFLIAQYMLLGTLVLGCFLKFILNSIDRNSTQPWADKPLYVAYVDLAMGVFLILHPPLLISLLLPPCNRPREGAMCTFFRVLHY